MQAGRTLPCALEMLGLLAPLLAATASSARPNASCPGACSGAGSCVVANSSGWQGRQLLNDTTDLPLPGAAGGPDLPALTCCATAASAASQRTRNTTDGLAWSVEDVGPAVDPERAAEGQRSFFCAVYDNAEPPSRVPSPATAGTTPPLPPFPPPPPPCSGFATLATCPKRCFWTQSACAAKPPLECGSNVAGTAHRNNALCVHLILNASDGLRFHFAGTAASENATVISSPPPVLTAQQDAWWAVDSGEKWTPPPALHPFRLCVQYATATNGAETDGGSQQIAVCVTLAGAFDLQSAYSPTLAELPSLQAGWQSQDPYVATVVVSRNAVAS
eukprot:COSAG04_NODE_4211_length_2229_cov_1.373239_2_plen_332_part_00